MLFQRITRRALASMLVIAFALIALAGCSVRNPNPTVLKVGDIQVGMSKYYSLYSSYKQLYSAYGIYDVSTSEKLRVFQDNIFDMLVESYLALYWAKQDGVTLTEEEEAKAREDLEAQIEETLASYAEDVDESVTDEAAIREAEMKLFKKDLREGGWTYKEYTGMLLESLRDEAIANKYLDGIYAERVSVTDEDVKARYDELLAEQQEAYAADPTQYYTDYSNFHNSGGQQPLVAPAGYRTCKHILIKFAEEGETKDVDAIVAEVQAKIDAGEDFDALIKEYNEDPGMESEPYATSGYLISEGIIDKYFEGFGAAAMALEKVGDVSGPVETEAGYHFIQYTADVSTEALPYDDVKDEMKEAMINEAKSAVYQELLEQWSAGTEVVRYYERVNNVR